MVVQFARIVICWRNSTLLPSSEGSQKNLSNSIAIISPTSIAAHNILLLAKRDRSAQ